jgi:hypothetical protein
VAPAGADAAYEHVHDPPVLDLQPVGGAAAGPVGRVEALGHHALQAVADTHREHGLPAAGKRRRDMDLLAGQLLGLEHVPPPGVGLADQRLTAQVHDVEDQVGRRDRGQQAG